MVITKLNKQQIIGNLRATGSTDRDVLYAKKEELLVETRRLKLLGVVPIILGAILSITLVGAIVGIPMIVFGVMVRRAYNHNLATSDEALSEYLQRLPA